MSVLTPRDASLLALLAHEASSRSESARQRLISHLESPRALEIAKAILGKPTRSKAAKQTAREIVRWATPARV